MRLRIAATLLACGFLAACSASAYKDQIASFATSGKALTSAAGTFSDLKSSDWAANARLNDVVEGRPLNYYWGCSIEASDASAAISTAAAAGAVPDDIEKRYALTIHRCDLMDATPVLLIDAAKTDADGAAAPVDGGHGDAGDGKGSDASDADTKAALARADDLLGRACAARANAADNAPAAAAPAGAPPPKVNVKTITAALNHYLSALQGITDADTIAGVQKNEKAANDGIASLLKATKSSAVAAPAVALLFSVIDIAIEQARYEALKDSILTLECAVRSDPAIKVTIKAVMRNDYGSVINIRASDASSAAHNAYLVLKNKAIVDQPGMRLILFNQIEADVVAKNDALAAAIKADPGATVDAFFDAHHKLALAVVDPSLQLEPVSDSLSTLGTSASALNTALNPPAKGTK